jgi:acetyltransferase-like isoleucine patch superfamily enzyme
MLHDFDINIRSECMIDASQYDEQGDLTMNAYITLADRWMVHENFMIGDAKIFVDDRRSAVRNREVVFKDL